MIARGKNTVILFVFLIVAIASCSAFASQKENPVNKLVKVNRVVTEKGKRRLTLFASARPINSYIISLGRKPSGHKVQKGDGKTPEGAYTIDYRIQRTQFPLALQIFYPNKDDITRAKKLGVSPGEEIMIHCIRNGLGWAGGLHRLVDRTQGCIAVINKEIEEMWKIVPAGTVVEIKL